MWTEFYPLGWQLTQVCKFSYSLSLRKNGVCTIKFKLDVKASLETILVQNETVIQQSLFDLPDFDWLQLLKRVWAEKDKETVGEHIADGNCDS